jgi:hypothetical protein
MFTERGARTFLSRFPASNGMRCQAALPVPTADRATITAMESAFQRLRSPRSCVPTVRPLCCEIHATMTTLGTSALPRRATDSNCHNDQQKIAVIRACEPLSRSDSQACRTSSASNTRSPAARYREVGQCDDGSQRLRTNGGHPKSMFPQFNSSAPTTGHRPCEIVRGRVVELSPLPGLRCRQRIGPRGQQVRL